MQSTDDAMIKRLGPWSCCQKKEQLPESGTWAVMAPELLGPLRSVESVPAIPASALINPSFPDLKTATRCH